MRSCCSVELCFCMGFCLLTGLSNVNAQLPNTPCWLPSNEDCPKANDHPCFNTECEHVPNGWATDPTDERKDIPLFWVKCRDNTKGIKDIADDQKPQSFDVPVQRNGYTRSDITVYYLCYREGYCALDCGPLTSQVKGTAKKRWNISPEPQELPGAITIYKGWCSDGAGEWLDVGVRVFDKIGGVRQNCPPHEPIGRD
jgi:hypothetical protein